MKILTRENADSTITLAISGNVDASNADQLEKAINQTIEKGADRLIVSFRDVGYISSAGLRVFLATIKKIKVRRGRLSLCEMSADVSKIFQLAGFNRIFDIRSSESDSLQFVHGNA